MSDTLRPMWHCRPRTRIGNRCLAADATVGPQDRALDHGVLFDLRLPAEDSVGPDSRARFDEDALVDEHRSVDDGAVLDTRIRCDARPRIRQADEGWRGEASIHDVTVDLRVLLRRSDVDPVAVVDVGDEGLAALDERRKVAALDGPRDGARNAIERIRLEDVNSGVDQVRRDLVGLGLLEEAPDVAVTIGFDQPVGRRILDRREDDGRAGLALAVHADDRRQVELRHHVAVEYDDRFRELVACVLDCAGRPERHRLDHVANLDSQVGAVAEDLLDPARLVVEAENHFVDLGDLLQQIDLVVKKCSVEDGNDGLGRVNRQRSQTSPLAPCEEDSLHDDP